MTNRGLSVFRRVVAQRWIGVVALLLLVHAVAIDTLHRHVISPEPHANAVANMAAPGTSHSASTDAPGGCPACQLQQSFTADVPRVVEMRAAEASAILFPTDQLRSILRAGDTSPPDRAPPVL